MNPISLFFSSALLVLPLAAQPQGIHRAIYTDPPADAAHPAKMEVLHIPSHGSQINGVLYMPPGAGPHPTLVICHGFPGNEKNLDLAQAVRRAGWNAVTFNYRGSWGSPGVFRFEQNLQDAAAVLAYLRNRDTAAKLKVDTKHLAIAGHSMGGWVTAHTASRDKALIGAILISTADMGLVGQLPPDKLEEMTADNLESLAGVTAKSMATELKTNAAKFRLPATASGLTSIPLLALTSNDGLAPHTDALVSAIRAAGGKKVTAQHVKTDHGWSDRRIALENTIIEWLATLLR